MTELDLSNAITVRISNRNALAIRIADETIWEAPDIYQEYSVFGGAAPPTSFVPSYTTYTDLGVGGWVANCFYTYSSYFHWTISAARLYIPEGSPAIGQSVKIGLYCTSATNGISWTGFEPLDIIEDMKTNNMMVEFPVGTLQAGWNTLNFNDEHELISQSYFAIGVSIGDGSMYINGEPSVGTAFSSVNPSIHLALSETYGDGYEAYRAFFKDGGGEGAWSGSHYGLDVVVRQPREQIEGVHSVWDDTDPPVTYQSYGDLGVDGWTASNFYSTNEPGTGEGWKLIGARFWVPPAEFDGSSIYMTPARCGYYIKASGAVMDTDDISAIFDEIRTSPIVSTVLSRGWNSVFFETPVDIPSGAGVVIGWQINTGSNYVSATVQQAAFPAKDGSPFALASNTVDTHRRGEYYSEGTYYWGFNDNHYGGDIIVKEPE